MSDEQASLIKKLALEIGGTMQQSRDKEVSGLMRDIHNRIDTVIAHISDVQNDLNSLKKDLMQFKTQFSELDKKTVKYDLTTTIVWSAGGIIGTALLLAALSQIVIK